MSAFPFTAPVVTEEDEKTERELLTDDERRIIHCEVYGGEKLIAETDEMLANGITMLYEALKEIPDAEKVAYLEALEHTQ
jgi:hypothetical protein